VAAERIEEKTEALIQRTRGKKVVELPVIKVDWRVDWKASQRRLDTGQEKGKLGRATSVGGATAPANRWAASLYFQPSKMYESQNSLSSSNSISPPPSESSCSMSAADSDGCSHTPRAKSPMTISFRSTEPPPS